MNGRGEDTVDFTKGFANLIPADNIPILFSPEIVLT